jgi:transcription antitermination factor NusA-like protein
LPIKIPICNFDAKTGILCAKCEQKLKSGQISEADVQVSRALVLLADSNQELNKVTLVKSYSVEGDYILEVDQQSLSVFRNNERLRKMLEEKLGSRVWIVLSSNSERRYLEDLFFPTRILAVNTVWLPDGAKLTKVIVPFRRLRNTEDIEKIKKIVKETKGIELMVESEREGPFRKF